MNIRKESVRFVKIADTSIKADSTDVKGSFNIEFVFDADAKCAITIYYFCTEDINPSGVTYVLQRQSEIKQINNHLNSMFV